MAPLATAKISEVKSILQRFIQPGKPQIITPYLVGYPGIGKSQSVLEFAQEHGMLIIDLRLSQCLETDLLGIPRDGKDPNFCEWKPPSNMPWADNPAFHGTKGILFLDELPQATEETLKASFQLIYDHAVGAHRLHKDWYIVAAGNLGVEDGNDGLTQFSSALKDRLAIIHIDRSSCAASWFQYAEKRKLNQDIINFLKLHPEYLYYESCYGGEKIFCPPRRWEKLCLLWEQNKETPLLEFIESVGEYLIYDLACVLSRYLEEQAVVTPQDILYRWSAVKDRVKQKREQSEEVFLSLVTTMVDFLSKNMVLVDKVWMIKDETRAVRNNLVSFLKLCRDDQVFSFMKEWVAQCGFKLVDLFNKRIGPENKAFWQKHMDNVPGSQRIDPSLDIVQIRDELVTRAPELYRTLKCAIESRTGRSFTDDELDEWVKAELAANEAS